MKTPALAKDAKQALTAAMVTGAGILILAVCGRRCLQILGPAPQTHVASSLVFLAGAMMGCAVVRLLSGHSGFLERSMPALVLAGMAGAVAGQRLCPVLNLIGSGLGTLKSSPVGYVLGNIAVAAALELVAAMSLGAALTVIVWSRRDRQRSFVWLVCLTGLTAGFMAWRASKSLIPLWGTLPTMALALIFLGLTVLLQTSGRGALAPLYPAFAGCLLLSLGRGVGSGYFYGQSESLAGEPSIRFFQIGASADIRVIQQGPNQLFQLDGVAFAGTGDSLRGELGLAYVPRLLRPGAGRVLVVGLATGVASGCSLAFPQTRVSCAEGEAAIVAAMRCFTNENGRPAQSPFFHLLPRTGLDAMKGNPRAYDLILVNYGLPRIPYEPTLLSRRFLEHSSTALSPEGMLAIRLMLDSMAPAALTASARALQAVFPHSGLFRLSPSEVVLLASNTPLLESNSISLAQQLVDAAPSVKSGLERCFATSTVRELLVAGLFLDEEGLRRIARADGERAIPGGSIWAFARPGSFHSHDSVENSALTERMIVSFATLHCFQQHFAICGCTRANVRICHDIAATFAANEETRKALETVAWGLSLDPDQPDLLADRLICSGETDSDAINSALTLMERRSAKSAMRVGMSLLERKQSGQASMVFDRLVKLYPQSAPLWLALAASYEAGGQLSRANECFLRASALDPLTVSAKMSPGE